MKTAFISFALAATIFVAGFSSCEVEPAEQKHTPQGIFMVITPTSNTRMPLSLAIYASKADQSGIWIDLNYNGKRETGEEVVFGSTAQYTYTTGKPVVIYGKVSGLVCSKNGEIGDLNTQNNPALTRLDCASNHLTKLDVSRNTALTYLDCKLNKIEQLHLNNNTALEVLYCYNNKLQSLALSNQKSLKKLMCNSNRIANLDVSACKALKELWCSYNQLNNLKVASNGALESMLCYENKLKSVAITNLISSLPNRSGKNPPGTIMIYSRRAGGTEQNTMPEVWQKAAAAAKNWKLLDDEGANLF